MEIMSFAIIISAYYIFSRAQTSANNTLSFHPKYIKEDQTNKMYNSTNKHRQLTKPLSLKVFAQNRRKFSSRLIEQICSPASGSRNPQTNI